MAQVELTREEALFVFDLIVGEQAWSALNEARHDIHITAERDAQLEALANKFGAAACEKE